jgi:hypothetical protein
VDANPLLPFVESDAQRLLLDVRPPDAPDLPRVPGLLAGAAEVDITPPPGMPKAGHSANAQTGTGFRTRLRAHVLHLRAGTTSLALVQCDLLAGSAIVAQLVAQAVAADTDVRLLGLFMGATHTHAGPGQFHGNELMNRYSSNHAGFDPAWTSFLVERIAAAVRQAVANRSPARLAFGATEVWGLTRNRSLDAHVRNENVVDKSTAPQRKYAAINPWLHLLRVDAEASDGGLEPLAAMVVFSVHGTGISQRDHAYNADVWAYLKGELGQHIIATSGHRAVVGAVEGTHGDVAPAVRPGQLVYPETERVGRDIGAAAANSTTVSRASFAPRFSWRPGCARSTSPRARRSVGSPCPRRRSGPRRWPELTRTPRRSSTASRRFARVCPSPGRAGRTARNGSPAGGACTTGSSRRGAFRACCPSRCSGSERPCWSGCPSRSPSRPGAASRQPSATRSGRRPASSGSPCPPSRTSSSAT